MSHGALPDQAGGYYDNVRVDLIAELPRPLGRVLDIGCGAGAAADALRAAGAQHLAGIEVEPSAAERAARRYDQVLAGRAEEQLAELEAPFDTILLYDVLEHLPAPEQMLHALHAVAAPSAHAQVSVPNARHVSLMFDLMFRGTFGYTDWGHRDRTHLRWFTRRDIIALLDQTGWSPLRTSHPALRRSAALDRLTRGRSTEFLVGQWYVLSQRVSA